MSEPHPVAVWSTARRDSLRILVRRVRDVFYTRRRRAHHVRNVKPAYSLLKDHVIGHPEVNQTTP